MNEIANRIFNEDVFVTFARIPDNSIDMVYGDPDYNVGINYHGARYTQRWDEYINWYARLASESLRVLKPDGNLFLLNYPKQNAYLRVRYLDEAAYDVFDYVWCYHCNVGMSPRKLTTAHRSILHATKTKSNRFYKNRIAVPYQDMKDPRNVQNIAKGSFGRMPYSHVYFDLVKNVTKGEGAHPCQIPLGLVEMLIEATTVEGDTVQVLFGGSGAELILCRELRRNFVSSEIHTDYYNNVVSRLSMVSFTLDHVR